jgi:cytochrome c553
MTARHWRNAWGSIALASAVVAVGFSGSALAGPHMASRGGVQAKIEYCATCHGDGGQGFYGYIAIPRIGGQQIGYIENQLRDFSSGLRHTAVMGPVARSVSPSMYGAIAAHFHAMNPPPLGGASGGSAARGRDIFMNGIPESNVPACWACHGEDAHGTNEIPRLAGQLPSYLMTTLSNWYAQRGTKSEHGLSAIMVPTTHNLTRSEMAAVAAYVSRLR